jgi:hypothetical protein
LSNPFGGKLFSASLVMAVLLVCAHSRAQDTPVAEGKAPPNQAIVGSKFGGRYFAPKPLKEAYDQLVNKVRSLEVDIREGRIDGPQASLEVKQLQGELAAVREKIEREKKFVPAGKIHTKSDSITFPLGEGRAILILATKVRIVGWDQPQVMCKLEKTVITTGEEDPSEHFEKIQVVHEHRVADDLVGKTPEQVRAEHQEFVASPEWQKLNPEQQAWRQHLVDDRIQWNAIYRPLQGKPIDIVSLKGFSHEDGNRQITLKVQSPNGEGSQSSVWQRHADLTLYVPQCEAIAVKGGLRGIDVQDVHSALILRGDDDRDYQAQFMIKSLQGALTAEGVPLQSIQTVHGDVDVRMTAYLGNSGTRHADDTRTSYVYVPEKYTYQDIAGNFRGRFVRADLELTKIDGQIDVENEYGQTRLVLDRPLSEVPHRIVADGGHITLQSHERGLGRLPVFALTECGTVRMGYPDQSFEDVHWNLSMGAPPVRRGWMGFVRVPADATGARLFEHFERVEKAVEGKDRPAGLDLISRGGSIELIRSN